VQLAPYRNQELDTGFPDIRWAQTDGFGYVPNKNMTKHFIAIAIDLPDFTSPYGRYADFAHLVNHLGLLLQ